MPGAPPRGLPGLRREMSNFRYQCSKAPTEAPRGPLPEGPWKEGASVGEDGHSKTDLRGALKGKDIMGGSTEILGRDRGVGPPQQEQQVAVMKVACSL